MKVRLLLASLLGLALPLMGGTAAHADGTSPFKDINAFGLLGFCDSHGKPMTSGSINDVPFAFRIVSDTPAPKAWQGTGRKATVYGFSPIQGTDPGSWTGDQVSPTSVYTNPKVPMAAMTYADEPLDWYTTGTPPTWDGLVQVRMYYSVPGQVMHMQPYPAAVLQVKGDTWTMIQGDANPSCSAGNAATIDQIRGVKKIPTAPPTWAANSTANPQHQSTLPATASPSGSPSGGAATGEDPGSGPAAGADGGPTVASASSTPVLAITLGVILGTVAAAAGVVALLSWRNRRST